MQTRSQLETYDTACCDHGHDAASPRLLWWIFLGTAFVANAYLAGWVYATNRLVGDVSAAIGAVILLVPILRMATTSLK